tara:strand:- start:504 stop:704 length:201 start_codon:yes stop_codon:yes gene_type:complete
MQYTLIHVCAGNHVLYREVYFKDMDARKRVQTLIHEKSWKLDNGTFYFGDVHIKTYDFDTHVTSLA